MSAVPIATVVPPGVEALVTSAKIPRWFSILCKNINFKKISFTASLLPKMTKKVGWNLPWLYFRIKFLQNFGFIFKRIDAKEDIFRKWLTRDSSWTSSFKFRCFIMSVTHRKWHRWTIICIWNWHWKLMIDNISQCRSLLAAEELWFLYKRFWLHKYYIILGKNALIWAYFHFSVFFEAIDSKLVFEINKMEGNIICIPHSAYQTPNFTNSEFQFPQFKVLLFFSF